MPLEYALQTNFTTQNVWKEMPSEKVNLKAPLGLTSLPKQVCERAVKKGFLFNIMLLGQGGLGKSTFLNTLLESELIVLGDRTHEERKNIKFTIDTFQLVEKGVSVTYNVFESLELGYHLNQEDGIPPIVNYLDEKMIEYLEATESPKRNLQDFQDPRVHACIYFLPPNGHSVPELDMALLSKIHHKVNIIPVIAKADSFTPEECKEFKKLVMESLDANQIRYYTNESKEYDFPFSLIGSEGFYQVNGQSVRGRKFRWGIAEVDNPKHCDFGHLKNLLIKEGMDDMIEKTGQIYEEFRHETLSQQGLKEVLMESDEDFQEKFDKIKKDWLVSAQKEEDEMKKVFKKKVETKEEEFKKKEADLTIKREKMREELEELKKRIQKEEAELEALSAHDETDEKKKKRISLASSLRKKEKN